jgi:hypothetical protein
MTDTYFQLRYIQTSSQNAVNVVLHELYRGKSEMTDTYFQLRYIQTSSRNAVNKKLFLTSLLFFGEPEQPL